MIASLAALALLSAPLRQFLKVTASTLSTLIPASSAEPALLPVQPALSKANYKLHKKTTEHLLCGFFFYHIINVKKDVIHHDSKKAHHRHHTITQH